MKASKLFIVFFILLFTFCKDKEKNTARKLKIYTMKKVSIKNCNDKPILLCTDIKHQRYIVHNYKSYRLDTYFYHQTNISFDYDILLNESKKCSFILYFGEKDYAGYRFTSFNIVNNKLQPLIDYDFQGTDYKSGVIYDGNQKPIKFIKYQNDTIARYSCQKINTSIETYLNRNTDNNFYDCSENYILRNKTFTSEPKTEEEKLIIKKFFEKYENPNYPKAI